MSAPEIAIDHRDGKRALSTNWKIFNAAATVGGLTLAVKGVGMFKEMAVASWLGTGDALDAFLIAFVLPTYAINVIAGSFNAALIPIQIETREREGVAAAQRLFSSTAALSLLLLAGASLLLALLGPLVIPWFCIGFSPEKTALTLRLYYLLLPMLALSGVAANWESLINAGERFVLVAAAPAIVSVTTLVAIWAFGGSWGINALAAGTVGGTVLQMALLAWGIKRLGYGVAPIWRGMEENVRRVVGQYLPMAAGSLFFCSAALIDQAMAGMLDAGSVAKLNYGNKLIALATGIGTMALGTAVLPHFSKMVALRDWDGITHTLRTYTRLILLVTIPATAVACFLSKPIVAFLFERGNFLPGDTVAVAHIQQMLLLQLPFYSLSILYVRMISSLQGNRVLMWGTGIGFITNISLNYLLMQWMGVAGIALATSLVYVAMCAYMAYQLNRRLKLARGEGVS